MLFNTSPPQNTPRWARPFVPRKSQRGAILVQFALVAGVIFSMLGVVDLGYMYYAKRDLQRIADLAALEAAQSINPEQNNREQCQSSGEASLERHWPDLVERSVVCGNWNSQWPSPRHFDPSKNPINAAHVTAKGSSPRLSLLPFVNRDLFAEAIATRKAPVAAFQVGSQLLSLDEKAPLGRLLKLVGLDIEKLSVLDSEGLANAKITPAGLLKVLGVDLGIGGLSVLSPEQLLQLNNLTLLHILDASVEAVSDSTAKLSLKAIIDVLEDAKISGLKLLDLKTPLLSNSDTSGLLAFLSLGSDQPANKEEPDLQLDKAALDLQLGVGDLVKTAIMVGANGHAVSIPELNVLNLVQASLTVVEPPSIAVGPVGTKANSAQVRLDLDIDSRRMLLLGPLLDAIGLRVNLPIKVEAVHAKATLDAVYCPDPSRNSSQAAIDLNVVSRLARIIIGHTDKNKTHEDNILIKTPLSLNVRGPIVTNVLSDQDEINDLMVGDSQWTRENRLFLGDTVDALLTTVFNILGGIFSPPILSSEWGGMNTDPNLQDARNTQSEMLAKLYLEETKVNGFYNIKDATHLILNGKGTPGTEGALGKLVNSNFTFDNAIPTLKCGWTLGLFTCPPKEWETGTFSEAFHAYTSIPYSLLDVVGIPTLGNGYVSCSGLLTSLLAWNSCTLNNLNNLLKRHHGQVALTNSDQLIASFKDKSSDNVTCSGALCVLLQPLLKPIKWVLNQLGSALLSPLLTKVLGLDVGKSEVKALQVNCNSAQLVY